MLTNQELAVKTLLESEVVPAAHHAIFRQKPESSREFTPELHQEMLYPVLTYLQEHLPAVKWEAYSSIIENDFEALESIWLRGVNPSEPDKVYMVDYGLADTRFNFFIKTADSAYPETTDYAGDTLFFGVEKMELRKPFDLEGYTPVVSDYRQLDM